MPDFSLRKPDKVAMTRADSQNKLKVQSYKDFHGTLVDLHQLEAARRSQSPELIEKGTDAAGFD
jgi:hypothetical protein